MFVHVRDELDVFEGKLESYVASVNQTGTLTPVVLQVKELIRVSKGKTLCYPHSPTRVGSRGTLSVAVHTSSERCC